MKAFINGRRVFGTPIQVVPPIYPSLMVSIRVFVCVIMETLDGVENVIRLHLLAGVFLRSWGSHRGGGGPKRPLLPHLWQDRPLYERLPHAQKVGILWLSGAQSHQLHVCNYPIHPDLDPSRGGTRREVPSTSEREQIRVMMAKTRPGRRTNTGGRETHRRSAVASCVGQAPTSRGTVSWTETLQVADVSAGNHWRGMNLLWLISLIFIWQEIWRWKTSLPPPLQLIWGIWGSRTDRYIHTYLRCHVWMSLKLLLPHLFCFWGVLFWKWSAACLHNRTCFHFSQRSPLQEEKKKRKQQNLILGPETGVYCLKSTLLPN